MTYLFILVRIQGIRVSVFKLKHRDRETERESTSIGAQVILSHHILQFNELFNVDCALIGKLVIRRVQVYDCGFPISNKPQTTHSQADRHTYKGRKSVGRCKPTELFSFYSKRKPQPNGYSTLGINFLKQKKTPLWPHTHTHTHIPADKLKKLGHAITVRGLAGSWRTDHQLSEHHRILLQTFTLCVCVCVCLSLLLQTNSELLLSLFYATTSNLKP